MSDEEGQSVISSVELSQDPTLNIDRPDLKHYGMSNSLTRDLSASFYVLIDLDNDTVETTYIPILVTVDIPVEVAYNNMRYIFCITRYLTRLQASRSSQSG